MSDTIPPQNQPVNITQVNGAPLSPSNPLPVSGTFTPSPGPTLSSLPVNVSASGANVLIPAVAGKVISVYRLIITFAVATTVTFDDGSTPLTGALVLYAGGSITLDYQAEPWFTTTAGNAFVMALGYASVATGVIYFTQA